MECPASAGYNLTIPQYRLDTATGCMVFAIVAAALADHLSKISTLPFLAVCASCLWHR